MDTLGLEVTAQPIEFIAPALDEAPPIDTVRTTAIPTDKTSDLSCQVCGVALSYGGRGRKPTRCAEHKSGSTARGNSAGSRRKQSNEELASLAVAALVSLNRFGALGLRLIKLSDTAGAIMDTEESFEKLAYDALVLDPDLCRQILAVGSVSAKASLAMAYVALGGVVIPTATVEIKDRRAEKREAKARGETT